MLRYLSWYQQKVIIEIIIRRGFRKIMNKELVKLSDNLGAVTDENGDIKIVEINKSENSLEDILLKENEIENIQNTICSLQADLTEKSVRKMVAIILGLIFVFASLPFSVCLILEETSYPFWTLLKITPFIFEGIIPFTFVGNPITFAKNLKILKEKIITTKEKLKIKQKELEDLKKLSEFKKKDESLDIINSKKDEIKSTKEIEITSAYSLNNNSFPREKVRVLRLVPKNSVSNNNK